MRAIVVVVLLASCTKEVSGVCCETLAECESIGLDSARGCDLGVCVANTCQMTGCDGNEDCAAPTPFCIANACEPCADDTACNGATPICDTTEHACRACSLDSECTSDVCDFATGACAEAAEVLYVTAGGSDTANCAVATPCSLSKALAAADSQHRFVAMANDTYTLGGVMSGSRAATVVGGGATIRVIDSASALSVTSGANLSVRNIVIDVQQSIGVRCDGASSFSMSKSLLKTPLGSGKAISSTGCTLTFDQTDFTGGISVEATDGKLVVDRCTFDVMQGPAISSSAIGMATITNSVLKGSSTALALGDTVFARVESNTILGTFTCTPTASAGHNFIGNVLVNVGQQTGSGGCNYNYNLASPLQGNYLGVGNITGNPLFVDEANNDFHLQPGSPAIDAGDPNSSEDHDRDGTMRPQGTRTDIGAFEFR